MAKLSASDVAEKSGVKPEAVQAVFKAVADLAKAGNKVGIHKFGAFEVRPTAARKGRNPQTGAELNIPAGKKFAFSASDKVLD